jgi:hypothetical protein
MVMDLERKLTLEEPQIGRPVRAARCRQHPFPFDDETGMVLRRCNETDMKYDELYVLCSSQQLLPLPLLYSSSSVAN